MDNGLSKFILSVTLILIVGFFVLIVLLHWSKELENSKANETVYNGDEVEIIDAFADAGVPHWTHMPLTYSINYSCGKIESEKIRGAFNKLIIDSKTLSFIERAPADIEITCSFLKDCYKKTYGVSSVCPHRLSNVQIEYSADGNFNGAKIEFIGVVDLSGNNNFIERDCGHLNRELHAILQTFGYSISGSEASIMYILEENFPGRSNFDLKTCERPTEEIDLTILADLRTKYP